MTHFGTLKQNAFATAKVIGWEILYGYAPKIADAHWTNRMTIKAFMSPDKNDVMIYGHGYVTVYPL